MPPAPEGKSLRKYAAHRKFELEELAYFALPRAWNKEDGIDRRFEKFDDQDLRDAIIHADDEPGGLGFLHFDQAAGTWELTAKGLRWVTTWGGEAMLRRAKAWKPAKPRTKPAKYETRASESSCNRKPSKSSKRVEDPNVLTIAVDYVLPAYPEHVVLALDEPKPETSEEEIARLEREQASDE